jgi:hypothetical protein
MAWTIGNYARLGVLLAIILVAVASTERSRAAGKLPRRGYSFRAVWKMLGCGILVATSLTALIYAWTDSADTTISLGGIIFGIMLVGSLREFFYAYQRKRDGAINLDKQ